MTPEESALLSDFGAQLFYAIAALICTCTFYGIYLLATSIAFYLLFRKGTRGVARKILLACLVLLLLTYTWAFVVKCAANLVNIQGALVENQSGGDLTTQIDNATIAVLPYQYMIAWPVTLNPSDAGFELIISDCIVTWRAWVIWTGSKPIRGCLLIFASASFVVNIVDCIFDDIALKSFWATSAWDTAAAFLSFGLNLVATLLIALRVWQYRQVMKSWVNHPRTYAENILLVLVESGAVYCVLQFVYSMLILFSERSPGGVTPLFIATSMALYPVSVIIIVNLEWSPLDYTLRNTYASNEESGNHRARISSLKFAQETQLERSQKSDNIMAK
ncbi:hypothetical protein EV359DRAFT_81633 [Lentinula novae-zelandiae]|nr:hypothetical protein EV359DRAFT_81633 [Lentinula novae-zelandiae]